MGVPLTEDNKGLREMSRRPEMVGVLDWYSVLRSVRRESLCVKGFGGRVLGSPTFHLSRLTRNDLQWWKKAKGALHRVKYPLWLRLAPRAGLEPATSRLQVPQFFNWAWTISSPACRKSRGGCRALVRRYWTGSAASSLCTVLPTH